MRKPQHHDRTSLPHQLRYALRHPRRIVPHLRRRLRDRRLERQTGGDHVAYYRAVMRHDTAHNPEAAVGSATHDRWLALGRMQYDYLLRHGLSTGDRFLEIGCGNLRAGRLVIAHLEPGAYHGVDISPEILLAAQDTLAREGLQDKRPYLTLVRDLRLTHLPDASFDVVHAHSVFSHTPVEIIDECLAHVGRVLAPDGFFDFTYNRTEGPEHQVLREDFYYRTDTLLALARSHGLEARAMADWDELPHKQSKIRVTHRS
ncbi:class I SAM-dependent methyltransferase [Streptomyces sp. 549]|uniref:class I SAM-dependent methyltransferase n=1 Tax=Streptomyces sp. 549 TaxID=3049076 RepID=UPI0024C20DEE|nr:class I SAM-dependent methyltransferase [Streptomyces sp. 549]MDK1474172.1 class I SAM-dependent methyltransferase [Streptomyces sp. 549]